MRPQTIGCGTHAGGLLGALLLLLGAAASGFCADTITVSGTISGSPAAVTVNGITATISGSTFMVSGVPVWPGTNAITAVATDAAGNTSSHAIAVQIKCQVTIQGTVTEAGSSVTVNGTAASVTGTSFTAQLPLPAGVNVLTVIATDAAGNASTSTSEVFVARKPVAHP